MRGGRWGYRTAHFRRQCMQRPVLISNSCRLAVRRAHRILRQKLKAFMPGVLAAATHVPADEPAKTTRRIRCSSRTERVARGGGYLDRFKSALAIRGLGAGHERRHELHVQKEMAVPPVSTCSCFTNAESWHPGQGGTVGWDSVDAEGFRIGLMRARDVRSLPLCRRVGVRKLSREDGYRHIHHDELDAGVRTTFASSYPGTFHMRARSVSAGSSEVYGPTTTWNHGCSEAEVAISVARAANPAPINCSTSRSARPGPSNAAT